MATYDSTLLTIGTAPSSVVSIAERNPRDNISNVFIVVSSSITSSVGPEHNYETFVGSDTKYYLMRAKDANTGSITYRSWIVFGYPDYAVERYTGAYSGGSINFTDVTVVSQWKK